MKNIPGKVFLKIHFGHLFLSIYDFPKYFMKKCFVNIIEFYRKVTKKQFKICYGNF